jgi:hypothetical protein
MADATLHQLDIPPDAKDLGGHEVLRAFVVDGALSVSLQRAFDEPGTWGALLVDLARQVANVFAKEGVMDAEEALADIRRTLEAEWDRSVPGEAIDRIN